MEYTSLPQALEALEKLQSTMAAYNHAMGVLSQDAATAAPAGSWEKARLLHIRGFHRPPLSEMQTNKRQPNRSF